MQKLLLLAIVSLFLGIPMMTLSGSQDPTADLHQEERFIGAWHLAWLEVEDAEGKLHKADCTGMLVYTRDGHMSVQVMYRNPQNGADAGAAQYAQNGYEASFGRYEVDELTRSFTYHIDGALVRNLIGKDLSRMYEFSGNQLIVKSSAPNEHWRVAWEHY